MLERVALRNYLCHKKTDIELTKLNVFCGRSGRGKSSIVQALLLLFCGTNDYTVGRSDVASQITLQQHTGSITVETKDKKFERQLTLPHSTKLLQNMGVSANIVRTCLDSNFFLNQSKDEQQYILFEAFGVLPEDEQIATMLKTWSPSCPRLHEFYLVLIDDIIAEGGEKKFRENQYKYLHEKTLKECSKRMSELKDELGRIAIGGDVYDVTKHEQ